MNSFGSSPQSAQTLFSLVIEAHELVRRYAHKKERRKILEFVPYAAGHGYLFGEQRCGELVAMAIAGPTDKPKTLHNFTPEGTQLFVYYALVHPSFRGRDGRILWARMMRSGLDLFPEVRTVCYFRRGVFHEYARGRWEGNRWVAQADSASSGTDASVRWPSWNGSTRGPSRDSTLLPTSIESSAPQSFERPPSEGPYSSSSNFSAKSQQGLGGVPLDEERDQAPVHSRRT